MWKEMIESKFGLPLNDEDSITLINYNTVVEKAEELKDYFDFVVFEEAHRLRKFHTGEIELLIFFMKHLKMFVNFC